MPTDTYQAKQVTLDSTITSNAGGQTFSSNQYHIHFSEPLDTNQGQKQFFWSQNYTYKFQYCCSCKVTHTPPTVLKTFFFCQIVLQIVLRIIFFYSDLLSAETPILTWINLLIFIIHLISIAKACAALSVAKSYTFSSSDTKFTKEQNTANAKSIRRALTWAKISNSIELICQFCYLLEVIGAAVYMRLENEGTKQE